MDLKYDLKHVVESMKGKLADSEGRASEWESIAVFKEQELSEQKKKVAELEESLKQEKAKTAGPVPQENKKEGEDK
ncbi:hypothetical protein J14TS2_17150 [Bacillus sp. J14TS2]|uniref:hypothetical protein n=1 Tax=Bacillus sp. J14TS2 TaxID=2807188 RepID=UPI001B1E9432|nr:hypothetical protein [Bacillus sp. J14TS2]GIN71240.1 hypothetical protein J14TS2_17150 [Bacillus sp. J14TS2]